MSAALFDSNIVIDFAAVCLQRFGKRNATITFP